MDFSALTQRQSKRFNNQKAMVKKVLQGKSINCPHCEQLLNARVDEEKAEIEVSCKKLCTQLTLELG